MAKTVFTVYGIDLTSFEDIKFSMWLDKSGIYMNTLSHEERTMVVSDWVNKERAQKMPVQP